MQSCGGRGNGKCQGPEAGACLLCSRTTAGSQWGLRAGNEEARGEKEARKIMSFPLSKVRNHQRVSNRRMTRYDLGFKRITLSAMLRVDRWEQQQKQGDQFGVYYRNPG